MNNLLNFSHGSDLSCAEQLQHRFDIFKGFVDEEGVVCKVRSVGKATLLDGKHTYVIRLKTLLDDRFYLLPERKNTESCDFVILTREPSMVPERKYFWNKVGEATLVGGPQANAEIVQLKWDLFGADDLFMNMAPYESVAITLNNNECLSAA